MGKFSNKVIVVYGTSRSSGEAMKVAYVEAGTRITELP